MYIAIAADGKVTVGDSDNFRAFKIVDHGRRDLAALRAALAGIAQVPDAQTAWVDRAAIPSLLPQPVTAEWRSGFDAMLSKAAGYGWIDAATGAVKAHIEVAG